MQNFMGWALMLNLILFLNLPILCHSAVKGECSSCHTMHNSQDGQPVAFIIDTNGDQVASDQPFEGLVKTDCLGCHTNTAAETIVAMEQSRVPIVFNLSEPTYPPDGSLTSTLAGGNFHWVFQNGDSFGHNVSGIVGEDLRFTLSQVPGGAARTGKCINCHNTLASVESGCEGCHVPHHHAGSSDDLATRENGWYRFLGSVMQRNDYSEPTPEGVRGFEEIDWEQNPQFDRHNSYQGNPNPFTNYLESGSISQKCAGCHGKFHNETISETTWLRHPVDVAIPNSGEFIGLTTYNPMVPVARQNVGGQDAGFPSVNLGADMVSCISCHRAHGSPYPSMLRWGYRDWPGTDSYTEQPAVNGCAVCHTAKD